MAFARLFPIDATDTQDGNRTLRISLSHVLRQPRTYRDTYRSLAESIRVILRNPRNVTPLRKGVEAVLNHMAETSEEKSESNEAA
jgi:hypothetical protein